MHPDRLVDIGINLAHDSYDADRAAVIERARAAGVTRMIVTGSSPDSIARAIELCGQWPGTLWATAGFHPHHAEQVQAGDWDALRRWLDAPGVVAAGECGLDYYRNFSAPAAQRPVFRRQLELAAERARPLFLHQRDAHRDFLAILDEHLPRLGPVVVHCFTGTAAEAQDYLDRGCYLGITGWICDERRGRHLYDIVGTVPLERLMLETDGPYLLPRDLQPRPDSRRNEPMYLRHIAEAVARARGEALATVAAATTLTAERFFGLVAP